MFFAFFSERPWPSVKTFINDCESLRFSTVKTLLLSYFVNRVPGDHYTDQTGLEFIDPHMLLPPKYGDWRCASTHPAHVWRLQITSVASRQSHSCMWAADFWVNWSTKANFIDWRWRATLECGWQNAHEIQSSACAALIPHLFTQNARLQRHIESSVTKLHCLISETWRLLIILSLGRVTKIISPSPHTWDYPIPGLQITEAKHLIKLLPNYFSFQTSPGQLLHLGQREGAT